MEVGLGVDSRLGLSAAQLRDRLGAPRNKQSLANVLRKAFSLSPVAIGLLQEAAVASSTRLSELAPEALAGLIYIGIDPAEAIAAGDLSIEGDEVAARRFLGLFTLPVPATSQQAPC